MFEVLSVAAMFIVRIALPLVVLVTVAIVMERYYQVHHK